MKSILERVLPTSAALLPLLAFAQPTAPRDVVSSYSDVARILNVIINWFFGILIIVAVIFVLYAAYLYLVAGGDQESVKKASTVLIYAAVAVAVAIIAKGIPVVVGSLFGVSVTTE